MLLSVDVGECVAVNVGQNPPATARKLPVGLCIVDDIEVSEVVLWWVASACMGSSSLRWKVCICVATKLCGSMALLLAMMENDSIVTHNR